MGFALHIRRFIRGGAVHPSETGTPACSNASRSAMPLPSRTVALRAVGDAGSGAAQQGNLLRQQLHQMGKPTSFPSQSCSAQN